MSSESSNRGGERLAARANLLRMLGYIANTVAKTGIAALVLIATFLLVRWTGWFSSPIVSSHIPSGNLSTAGQLGRADGLVYYLPRTVIDISISFTIKDCAFVKISNEPTDDRREFVADIVVKQQLTRRTEADPEAAYLIEAASFGASWWSTDLSVTMREGMIVSLNTRSASLQPSAPTKTERPTIQHQPSSGEVSQAGGSPDLLTACGERVVTALARRKEFIEAYSREKDETLKKIVEEDLRGVESALTREFRTTMVPRMDRPNKVSIDPKALFAGAGNDLAKALTKSAVHVILMANRTKPRPRQEEGQINGIVYRAWGSGTLFVCRERCDLRPDGTLAPDARLDQAAVQMSVAQFGVEAAIPATRTLFSNRTLRLTFSEDGALAGLGVSDEPQPLGDFLKHQPLPPTDPPPEESKGK